MQKRTIIKKIKAIIEKHGTGGEFDKNLTAAEMALESSPCINNFKGGCVLLETFEQHKVTAVTYLNDNEKCEDYICYEDLAKDILEEILSDLENYEVEEDKFLTSCKE